MSSAATAVTAAVIAAIALETASDRSSGQRGATRRP